MSDAEIEELCSRIGLARGYWDVSGIWREPSAEDRLLLIDALGCPAEDAAARQAAFDRLEQESWRPLPPVHVTIEAEPSEIAIVAPAGFPGDWRVVCEDGAILSGTNPDGAVIAHRNGGERRLLRLPALPAGYHRLELPNLAATMPLIVTPSTCFLPPSLDQGGRVWGVSVQLYAVRSARNWGIGDYTDLAILARLAGEAGADVLGVNPLHARSLVRPVECSPYSPVSRLALDTLAIDVEAIPEFATSVAAQTMVGDSDFQVRLEGLRRADMVDYAAVAALKLRVLRLLFDQFRDEPDSARRDDWNGFVTQGGSAIRHYAQFEALRAYHDPKIGAVSWQDWPSAPTPDDPVLAEEVDFQLWLQFIADAQLTAACKAAEHAGMRIGLYGDLAVGAAGDSAEAWSAPALASRATIGAPPDAMSELGQNWGMPAPDPRALAKEGFAPFVALLRANMRHAGAIRIDHAMALARLFVIPPGRTGVAGSYLAYPFEALTGILALESQRHRCLIIGEDLGTVPQGFRETMAMRAVLSYKVLLFERYPDGAFKAPADYAWAALATASTHDLTPLAGYWTGADLPVRARLGLLGDVALAEADRQTERERFLVLLDWQRALPEPRPDLANPSACSAPIVAALHRLIAGSGSAIAMTQLDDILKETSPINLPGTSREYPNWQRKLSLGLDDAEFLACFDAAAAIFRAARPRDHGNS